MELFDFHTTLKDDYNWNYTTDQHSAGLVLPSVPSYILSGGFGDMFFRPVMPPEEGFSIWLSNYDIKLTRTFKADAGGNTFELNILLTDEVDFTLKGYGTIKQKQFQYNIRFLPEMSNTITLYKGRQYATMDIHYTVGYFEELSKHYPGQLEKMIGMASSKKPVSLYPVMVFMPRDVQFLARDIMRMVSQPKIDWYTLSLAVKIFTIRAITCEGENNLLPKENIITGLLDSEELMLSDLSEFMTVSELSRVAGVSITKYKAVFKDEFGTSPYAYWNMQRMNEALKKVLYTPIPIIDICYQLGFKDLSSFSRAFKTMYACSPMQLRKRVKMEGHFK
jgi:AraC-like DNA-binding protein